MSRQQLVEVALLLNSRLPSARQIEVSAVATNAHIRHSIETLVGIVPETPGAPKGVKSRTMSKNSRIPLRLEDPPFDNLPSPPTSPLAMRVSRRRELPLMASPPRVLECLQEEDEEQFFATQRPLKMRRYSGTNATSTDFSDGSIGEDTMDLASPARALRFSTSIEMISNPTSVISPGEGMILSSPFQKCVAGSGDSIVTSLPSGGSRVPVTADGRLASENTFPHRSGIDGPARMGVSWAQASNLGRRSDLFG